MYLFIKVHRKNHTTFWVGRGFKDHLVPISLLWAGTPHTHLYGNRSTYI